MLWNFRMVEPTTSTILTKLCHGHLKSIWWNNFETMFLNKKVDVKESKFRADEIKTNSNKILIKRKDEKTQEIFVFYWPSLFIYSPVQYKQSPINTSILSISHSNFVPFVFLINSDFYFCLQFQSHEWQNIKWFDFYFIWCHKWYSCLLFFFAHFIHCSKDCYKSSCCYLTFKNYQFSFY